MDSSIERFYEIDELNFIKESPFDNSEFLVDGAGTNPQNFLCLETEAIRKYSKHEKFNCLNIDENHQFNSSEYFILRILPNKKEEQEGLIHENLKSSLATIAHNLIER